MSKDVTYPFENQLHLKGVFAGVQLPTHAHMTNALSTSTSNAVPQMVDSLGRLHMGVYVQAVVKPCTDLIFKIDGNEDQTAEAVKRVHAFITAIRPNVEPSQHLAIRRVSHGYITYVVVRIYFTADFKCTEHPEMRLGEPSQPYYCPVCNTMQIAGLPHIEEDEQ